MYIFIYLLYKKIILIYFILCDALLSILYLELLVHDEIKLLLLLLLLLLTVY